MVNILLPGIIRSLDGIYANSFPELSSVLLLVLNVQSVCVENISKHSFFLSLKSVWLDNYELHSQCLHPALGLLL